MTTAVRWFWVAGLTCALCSCDSDARPRESGGDAGSRDAGPIDAGSVDSGRRDSGSLDSGASTRDAGSGDAGAKDSGAIDAGPVLPPPDGPLKGLPSAPGAHISKIEALADKSWLDLGAPAPDPVFGVARGRSWGGRALVLAPDLRGAFFTGEGVHAFVKPDGYAMDDFFFYDINAHRWIAVYPGMHPASFTQRFMDGDLLIDDNGQLVDDEAQPIPVHTLIHAWSFLTYDSDARKLAFVAGNGLGRYYLPGAEQMEPGLTMAEQRSAAKTVPPMSPWFYDVATGKFEHDPISAPPPAVVTNGNGNFGNFAYVPTQKRYFYGAEEAVAFFDPATKRWSVADDSGPRPPDYDHGGCYDSKRDRIYMGPGDDSGGLYIFDLKTNTWTKPASSGTAPPGFRTNSASVFYDVVNDVVTVMRYEERRIYVYSPASDSWTSEPFPSNVAAAIGNRSVNAFYDPQLNAYFLHVANDSEDDGVIWVYRLKRA